MDKEELEKITVEFMNKYNNIKYARIDSIMGKQLLAYAELFEKRIVELEATNEKISGECHKLVDSFEKMQKENAELKNRNQELLESCEGATMMYKDLQKAKELLTKVMKCTWSIDCFVVDEINKFLNIEVGK